VGQQARLVDIQTVRSGDVGVGINDHGFSWSDFSAAFDIVSLCEAMVEKDRPSAEIFVWRLISTLYLYIVNIEKQRISILYE
jgi:hypothetical protein